MDNSRFRTAGVSSRSLPGMQLPSGQRMLGCMVDVTNVNTTNRTFTLTSPDTFDPCIKDDGTVEY